MTGSNSVKGSLIDKYASQKKSLTCIDLLEVGLRSGVAFTFDWWVHERPVDLCRLRCVHVMEVRAALIRQEWDNPGLPGKTLSAMDERSRLPS